jgi:hypothetical protein
MEFSSTGMENNQKSEVKRDHKQFFKNPISSKSVKPFTDYFAKNANWHRTY